MPITLEKPRFELAAAEACCALMAKAQTFAEMEAAWVAFLGRIERVWSKTLSHMKAFPRFTGWKGKYERLRNEDDLLSYLTNARGADEHTITEVVGIPFKESSMGRLGIRAADGTVTPMWDVPRMRQFLEQVGLSDEAVVHAEPSEKATFRAELVRVNIIHNRGRAYSPPKRYLGKDVPSTDPQTVAKLGLQFYQAFVDDVEVSFP